MTAANGTMQRWLQALQKGRLAIPRKRPASASMGALASKNIEEMEAYDEWARDKLLEDEDLTYRGLRL